MEKLAGNLSLRGHGESPSLRRCPERCPKATLGSLQLEMPLAVAHQRGSPARSLSPPLTGGKIALLTEVGEGRPSAATAIPEGRALPAIQ